MDESWSLLQEYTRQAEGGSCFHKVSLHDEQREFLIEWQFKENKE